MLDSEPSDSQEQHQLSHAQPRPLPEPERHRQEQGELQIQQQTRPWMVIAEELRRESDPVRIVMLAEELNYALGVRPNRKRTIRETDAL